MLPTLTLTLTLILLQVPNPNPKSLTLAPSLALTLALARPLEARVEIAPQIEIAARLVAPGSVAAQWAAEWAPPAWAAAASAGGEPMRDEPAPSPSLSPSPSP